MKRKESPDVERFTVILERKLYDRFENKVKSLGHTKKWVVNELVRAYVNRPERPSPYFKEAMAKD